MAGLKKIISGGQTGVDQAALNAAIDLGLEHGGWCPPGRICEEGIIPDRYNLEETPTEKSTNAPSILRSLRTEWNVKDSEATLILSPKNAESDPGTDWTLKCVIKYNKLYLIADPLVENTAGKILTWLCSNSFKILNIAGPAESKYPGIGEKTYELLYRVVKNYLKL